MPVPGFLPLENSGLCQVFLPGDERLALSRAGKQSVTLCYLPTQAVRKAAGLYEPCG